MRTRCSSSHPSSRRHSAGSAPRSRARRSPRRLVRCRARRAMVRLGRPPAGPRRPRALPPRGRPEGRVITCEIEPEFAAFARRHIEQSPYSERIEIRVGPALDTIETLSGPFDFVFIDADKTGYPAYYEAVLPKLAPSGLIALDNTLRSGTVLDPGANEAARAIDELNATLARDARVVCTLLTVRDGITLVRRR